MFKVGDKVVFGRPNGEKTNGTVVKVNRTTVLVAQDEERGQTRIRTAGTKWKVPLALVQLQSQAGAIAALPFKGITVAPPSPMPPLPSAPVRFKVGAQVEFDARGRTYTGTVKAINSKTISVDVGTGVHWRVSPALLRPNGIAVGTTPDRFATINSFVANKRNPNEIMSDILGCYASLSPENLTCDGELKPAEVEARRRSINARLNALHYEIGREVTETEAFAWYDQHAA